MVRLFLLGLALFAAGCTSQETIGGRPPEKHYATAVSLSPGASEIAMQHTKTKLIGRTESCNWPPPLLSLPSVMKGVKPNYEMITNLRPDVVLYDPQLIGDSDIAQFKSLGIPTFALGADTIAAFTEQLYDLGSLSGSETQVSQYCDDIETALSTAKSVLKGTNPKVAVMIPGAGAEHMINGNKSFLSDILTKIGATPIGPDGANFQTSSTEWLIAQNPDVIISAGQPDPILSDVRLKSIEAVKKKRVFGLKEDVILRRGARVDRVIRSLADVIMGAS